MSLLLLLLFGSCCPRRLDLQEALASAFCAVAAHKHIVDILLDEVDEHLDGRTFPRHTRARPDYAESEWGRYAFIYRKAFIKRSETQIFVLRMLRDNINELRIPGSDAANTFRKRFRLPFPVFEALLSWVMEWLREEGLHDTDAVGNPSIPTSLKVLAALRILGRGTCADGITELSGMSPATTLNFFHRFCK